METCTRRKNRRTMGRVGSCIKDILMDSEIVNSLDGSQTRLAGRRGYLRNARRIFGRNSLISNAILPSSDLFQFASI